MKVDGKYTGCGPFGSIADDEVLGVEDAGRLVVVGEYGRGVASLRVRVGEATMGAERMECHIMSKSALSSI